VTGKQKGSSGPWGQLALIPGYFLIPKTVDGRLKGIPFVCHYGKYFPYIKGEADLVI
jgi:hypothetical protein